MKRRPVAPPVPPKRDREADRALFEQAVERLDKRSVEERRRESEGRAEQERRARFDKRVSRGEAEPEAHLDLHGFDRDEAATRLRRFLASVEGEVVLIVHGRGAGILRAAAIDVLDRHPRVAEHRAAPRNLGGEGARLVRLRRRALDR
jgi:DNA-nicking Smr family endonuclease